MLWVVWYGLGIGAGLGFMYDVLRIRRIACAPSHRYGKKSSPCRLLEWHRPAPRRFVGAWGETILLFWEDLLFCMLCGAVVAVMIFYANHGKIRVHALVCCALGFWFYRSTVGRLTVRFADAIIAALRRAMWCILSVTIFPLWRVCKKGMQKLFGTLRFRRQRRRTQHYFNVLPQRMFPYHFLKENKKRKKDTQNV